MADVTMPQLGETVTEGTITRWFKSVGDHVALDEVLFEVSTDKVDSEVPSPLSGVVTEIRAAEGDTVEVGTVLAVVEAAGSSTPAPAAPEPEQAFFAEPAPSEPPPVQAEPTPAEPGASPAPAAAPEAGAGHRVTMPQLGETVTEGTITRWFKSVGDHVAVDEVLFEVSTDKVDSEVPSPASGVLSQIVVNEGETVEVGAVLAMIGSEVGTPAPAAPAAPAPASPPAPAPSPGEPADEGGSPGSELPLSPVVRRLVAQSGIDATAISGSGVGGRVTRSDVERAIKAQGLTLGGAASAPQPVAAPEAAPVTPAPAGAATSGSAPAPATSSPAPPPSVTAATGDTVVPMNNIRRRTGEHMVMSKAVSPHVLTAVEVDFEGVEQVRRTHRAQWKQAEGFSLTYLPFIIRAVVDALREYPHINASVGENELILHHDVNLAIAVDLDFQGLLAPVIKAADTKRLRALARETSDLANRARAKQLSADEIMGGTFTITNPGQYGTLMQFPIINQPQVAILSTDGIRRKPVVITDNAGNEGIAIHSVGILALAWDHRAFDGAYVAAFMNHLRSIIETRDWAAELS